MHKEYNRKILLEFLDKKCREAEEEIKKEGKLSDESAIPLLLRSQFSNIAHLDEEVSSIKEEISGIKTQIRDLSKEFENKLLSTQIAISDRFDSKIDAFRNEVQTSIKALSEKSDSDMKKVREDMKTLSERLESDMKKVREDMKALSERLGSDMKKVREDMKALSERLESDMKKVREDMKALSEKSDSEIKKVHAEIEKMRSDMFTAMGVGFTLIAVLVTIIGLMIAFKL
ncbi:MAG: hypothetical protein ACE5J9_02980 [Methanosarcinales archaeon]